MTTTTWSTVVDQSSDAAFRVWGAEFAAKLAVVGLVQTADTGQINWASVTRASTNTAAGYEIWRFADSSLYLKIEYGSGGSTSTPAMWVTVGTGSNGSGTITGQTNTRSLFTAAAAPTSTVTSYVSYMCAVADAFSVAWKLLGMGASTMGAFLVVGKTTDGAGAATSTGFGVMRHTGVNTPPSLQSVRTASVAVTYNDRASSCIIPGDVTTSLDGADFQAYAMWLNVPTVIPFNWAAGVVLADVPRLTSISVAMVGSTAHTYLSVGLLSGGASYGAYVSALYSVAVIYE